MRVRYAAAAISGAVALFYLGYFFVVDGREQAAVPHTESMAPIYLVGATLFLVGAVLLIVTDRAVLLGRRRGGSSCSPSSCTCGTACMGSGTTRPLGRWSPPLRWSCSCYWSPWP